MKANRFYIYILFLCGVFAFSSIGATNIPYAAGKKLSITSKAFTNNQQKQPVGDSPFIRFHNGIGESGVSVSTPNESIIPLKPVNDIPEKFAGIIEYISTLSFRLPVTREIFYATPLRSPPFFN